MNSCDYIRKPDPSSPNAKSPKSRVLFRKGSEKHSLHKSHEVLTDYKSDKDVCQPCPSKCDLNPMKSIDRKDQKKRNSRSEDNLLGIAQKLVNISDGQIILTQDLFTVSVIWKGWCRVQLTGLTY